MDVIELLTDVAGLKGTAYVELQPGAFTGVHWKDGSAFVRGQVFGYVEPVFARHVPSLNPYGPSVVGSATCRGIATDLRVLAARVRRAESMAQVRQAGVGFSDYGLDHEFETSFPSSVDALADFASRTADWLEQAASRAGQVSILGL